MDVLVFFLLVFSTIKVSYAPDPPYAKVTIRLSEYNELLTLRLGMQYLQELQRGIDPCQSFRRGQEEMSEFWARDASSKCTLAITAFEKIPTELQGPCQNPKRLKDMQAVTAHECIYGDETKAGYCGVKVFVETDGCLSFCPKLWLPGWLPMTECVKHLEFVP